MFYNISILEVEISLGVVVTDVFHHAIETIQVIRQETLLYVIT